MDFDSSMINVSGDFEPWMLRDDSDVDDDTLDLPITNLKIE
jgi:hypothetical protein